MMLTQNAISQILNNYKIVPLVGSFVLGILINEYINHPWILVVVLGLVSILVSIFFRNLSFLLFIALGLAFAANSQLTSKNNILDYTNKKIDLQGTLYRSPESSVKGSRIYLDTQYIFFDDVEKPVSGKVIIYSNENTQSLVYGDKVRFLDIKLSPIENYKNPDGFDLKRFYERQSIYARGFIDGEEQIISFGLSESYSPILQYIDSLRRDFGNYVRANFNSPQSEILNAITIGEKRGIPDQIRTEFSKAGVAHVLVISGLHVGAVALAFFFVIKWLLKRSEYILIKFQVPRLAAALTILPIFLYTAVAGFSTSTVRAFIMISLYLFSMVIGREEHRLNTLCAAALIILLWHPWSLFELSFQLSFSAVFAILVAHKFYPFKFATLEDKFFSLAKTTIAAGLITFPLVANSFGILPLISIPANLTIVPLVEFILVPISLISFLVFLISPNIADPLMSLNVFFIEMVIFGVQMFLKIPYSSLTVPPMNIFSWVLFLIIVLSLIANSAYTKLKYVIPFIIVGFIATLIYPVPGKSIDSILAINFLDVGENRSLILIELPNGKNVLVSGGHSRSGQSDYIEKAVTTRYLLNKGIKKIDLLILTSINKGHLNGAIHLAEKFDVEQIITNGEKLSGGLWENIYNNEIKWHNLFNANETLLWDNVKIEILRPSENFIRQDTSLPYPVALKLTHGDSSFLFGETLNNEAFQLELLNNHKHLLESQVLYIPDVDTGTITYEFIEFISPNIFITNEIDESMSLDPNIDILDINKMGAVRITSDEK